MSQSKTAPNLLSVWFFRATLPSTRSRTAETTSNRLPARKYRWLKASAHERPKSTESIETWLGVMPRRIKNEATGSEYLMNFGRSEVIFIA